HITPAPRYETHSSQGTTRAPHPPAGKPGRSRLGAGGFGPPTEAGGRRRPAEGHYKRRREVALPPQTPLERLGEGPNVNPAAPPHEDAPAPPATPLDGRDRHRPGPAGRGGDGAPRPARPRPAGRPRGGPRRLALRGAGARRRPRLAARR